MCEGVGVGAGEPSVSFVSEGAEYMLAIGGWLEDTKEFPMLFSGTGEPVEKS